MIFCTVTLQHIGNSFTLMPQHHNNELHRD